MNKLAHALESELGISIRFFETIPSTSLFAKEAILSKGSVPDLIVALEQTNGQGRVGKKFYSPKGTGLYLTFVLKKDDYSVEHITPRLSLCVCHAIEKVFPVRCGVKWVNDIYLNQRKVAGILCQNVRDYYLFGIGINVEEPDTIPQDLIHRFGSLCKKCDPDCYKDLILNLYRGIKSIPFQSTSPIAEYRNRCIHLGKKISVLSDGVEVVGICSGIDDNFYLSVFDGNITRNFSSGIMSILE